MPAPTVTVAESARKPTAAATMIRGPRFERLERESARRIGGDGEQGAADPHQGARNSLAGRGRADAPCDDPVSALGEDGVGQEKQRESREADPH